MPVATFPAPSKGWIKNQRLVNADPAAAEVLDDIFPTMQGARLRKGSAKHATIGAAAKRIFVHRSGSTEKMFAATETAIYEVTNPADPDVVPTADVTSLASGDWASQMFTTSGGDFLVIANGDDAVRHYNGSTWASPTITGATSADLSFVWAFKNRLWFIEKDSTSAWYFATNAVAGAATEFPLRGVFNRGGSILFGATWSIDAGDGLDDVMVFVTDQGEAAVYTGTDPSSEFAMKGVYYLGKPLNKHSWFKAGGDLAIATEDGIVSIAEALQKDRAALAMGALTFPIEDAWLEAVSNSSTTFPVTATLWSSQTMLVVGVPSVSEGKQVTYVANVRSGAWCRFKGWDVRCAVVFNDKLYFGTNDSTVVEAETGGSDQGSEYSALWVPKFQEGNASNKIAKMARFRGGASEEYQIALRAFSNYEIETLTAAPSTEIAGTNLWGTGVWGTMVWGGAEYRSYVSQWQAVHNFGASLAPAASVTTNRTTDPTLEIIAMDLIYEQGNIV